MIYDRRQAAYRILGLIRGVLTNDDPVLLQLNKEDTEYLYKVAKSYGMAAITDHALRKAELDSSAFQLALEQSQRRSLVFDAEYQKISGAFENAGIRHLPMKGVVMKKLYPSLGLREMTDIDIWFDEAFCSEARGIMLGLGYQVKEYGDSNHDVYIKQPNFCVELHRQMTDPDTVPTMYEYYRDYPDRLSPAGGSRFQLCQSREDFYIFMTAHTFKHHTISGVGLRALADEFVFLQGNEGLDTEYIEAELRKMGILAFEERLRSLSQVMFYPERLSDDDKHLLDDFIYSKLFGTKEKYYRNTVEKKVKNASFAGKMAYIRSRLKVPANAKKKHPVLGKHPILVPFYAVYRPIKAVATKPRELIMEATAVIEHDRNKKSDKE